MIKLIIFLVFLYMEQPTIGFLVWIVLALLDDQPVNPLTSRGKDSDYYRGVAAPRVTLMLAGAPAVTVTGTDPA